MTDPELFAQREREHPEWYAESRQRCGRPQFDECPCRRPADGLCTVIPLSCFWPCAYEKFGPWNRAVEEHRYNQRPKTEDQIIDQAQANGRLF